MGVLNGQLHRPVLYQEVIDALDPKSGGLYIDGTLGAGGHAFGLLQASSPDGRLLGMDIDPRAIELARQRLEPFQDRVQIVQASYVNLPETMFEMGWSSVQGVLLDLGVSSMQIDTPERGFSFQVDAPLDMRFDPQSKFSASDLVNSFTEVDLAQLLFEYGEERHARQIARAIVKARPIVSTIQLADLIVLVYMRGKGSRKKGERTSDWRIHPATKTFQAIRIAVNQELMAVEKVLPLAVDALAPGGRLVVISFHSLEDRIVKQFFRQESRDCLCPPKQPVCVCGHKATITEITHRPIFARPAEVEQNPRSRSARLRVAEKKF